MFEIRWERMFDSAHRIYEHEKKCRYLHGHSYRVKVLIRGELEEHGMLVDFGILKSTIHDLLDHKVILYEKDPLVPLLEKAGQKLVVLDRNPTAENLALFIASLIIRNFENVREVEVGVFETPTQSGFVKMTRENFVEVNYKEII
ncbi:MAG TPA: 6-carboxytetrahydropterin synthase [candidate division WOR-3 bacterium]|uniref:6-carboxy-5,6,7,8-tetrahydropterin synthase n=1 Tax=candidate division WOR-3 bacterium TaxID=2052148 RepID=A0A7V0LU40_UNCW3|nr:MAG: 6-pyruvoyl tetrahydrobiopterin synthase [Candidatus Hydrothermae bacterium]HDL60282.1 6-carboxytetrahydropterin synthase [candidate division WOR-3 bacterium]